MPSIRVELEVSRESLLRAIEHLGPLELDQLVSEVLATQSTGASAIGNRELVQGRGQRK